MRALPALAFVSAVSLVAGSASALVYEPNNVTDAPDGLLVPIDSSPEVQLYTLFQQRGESIDWRNDAQTTPSSFSPLCGFTATYILNQAGSAYGIAWYNETGTAPAPADLHVIVPANSPVGTTFTGTTILDDPAYTGGTVGFALIGGETHYTNDAYSTVCSDPSACNPAGPWITALVYASTVTSQAYYVAFEDGPTSAGSWDNDGDFNDDVFFITGVQCSGGGQVCDTGAQGVCASGVTQCSGSGTVCEQVTQPSSETCNGLDDDCNGVVDDNAPCPTNEVCLQGACVAACRNGVFCPGGNVCSNGYCITPSCVDVTCPSGEVCDQGNCKGPCDDVVCPFPDVCRVGACVDPCAGVTCSANDVCDQGVCVTGCACQPCTSGSTCDSASNLCVASSCEGVSCASGSHCSAGACVDDCAGAVCPSGQACQQGACAPLPDAGASDAGRDAAPTSDAALEAGSDAAPGDATLIDATTDATTDATSDATLADATPPDAEPSGDAGHPKDAGKGKDSGAGKDAGHGKDAGPVHADAGKTKDAGGRSLDAAFDAGLDVGASSGCGCRVAGPPTDVKPGLSLLGFVALVFLRRRSGKKTDERALDA